MSDFNGNVNSKNNINKIKLPFSLDTLLEGKFRLDKVLGCGAMGVVYRGYDIFLEREVAIKVLKTKYFASRNSIETFRQEAVAMATINHPNIARIYSFGLKDNHYYFVMEYINGKDLASIIQSNNETKNYVSLDLAIGIITQISSGLSSVHSLGIVHRDVKPANILIESKSYRAVLTDFGLTGTKTKNKKVWVEGTPLYLAPERISSKEIPENKKHLSDIYALGCIFFEFLTGRPPYETENLIDLFGMHMKAPIPRITLERPDLPLYVDSIVAKAMSKNINDRYQSCNEFKEDILNYRMPSQVQNYKHPFVLLIDTDTKEGNELSVELMNHISKLHIVTERNQEKAIDLVMKYNPDAVVIISTKGQYSILELCSKFQRASAPIFLYLDNGDNSLVFLYRELGVKGIFKPPFVTSNIIKSLVSYIKF